MPARLDADQTLLMVDTSVIRERFAAVGPGLNERPRRQDPVLEDETNSRRTYAPVRLLFVPTLSPASRVSDLSVFRQAFR
jgi:hypothetical protein